MPIQIQVKKLELLSPEHPLATVMSPKQRKFSNARVRKSLFRLFKQSELCSMATVTKQNRAHISHVYFCYSKNAEIYFLSDPTSLHCRNLLTNPSMAVSVYDSSQEWGGSDRGMHLFGTCREATGKQAMLAERCYGERFRAYKKWQQEFEGKHFQYRFFRFLPTGVQIFDERVFGDGELVLAAVGR